MNHSEPNCIARRTISPLLIIKPATTRRFASIMVGSFTLLGGLLCLLGGQVVRAQSPTSAATLDRQAMRQEMLRLQQICQRLGLEEQAELCRTWVGSDRPDQQRYYLPAELPGQSSDTNAEKWRTHFVSARQRHAEYLFDQARQRSAENDAASAFRLLWQVLRENPDHAQARQALGPLCTAISMRPKQRSGGGNAAELADLGPLQRWQSRNFLVVSRADAKATLALMQLMEQYHAIWSQRFYDLWAPPDILKVRLEGKNTPWPEPQQFEVILLADRTEYLKLLGIAEANIDVSLGYYNPKIKKSFFYATGNQRETIFHELTHQLFAQAARLNVVEPQDQLHGAWAIEGIALYMESLRLVRDAWTLGGIESPRLQTARYRALRDQYWPLWRSYSQGSIADWKQAPDIALAYSHAAGLVHAFLDLMPNQSQARAALVNYLKDVYQGKPSSDELLKTLGTIEQEARENYRNLMTVTDQQLVTLEADNSATTDLTVSAKSSSTVLPVTQLVLSRSNLENWGAVGRFKNLEWLDISFSNIPTDQTAWLSELLQLKRLSLEGTQLDGSVMPTIAKLSNLEELDLSLCKIGDADLALLANHPGLSTLWLTGTQITERSLATIATLSHLQQCDVTSTLIAPETWKQFVEAHPRLRKTHSEEQSQ